MNLSSVYITGFGEDWNCGDIKDEENRMMHYNDLKAYVAEHHHFPDKHKVEFRGLLNWTKYSKEDKGRHFA